jgi:DNA modification methylase
LAKLESENDIDPDDAPEAEPDVVTQSGDLWIAGTHRILCGDGTKVKDLERLLDKPSDMVFTDFPYNVAYEGKTARKLTLANDDLGTGFSEFLQSACRALLTVNNGTMYLCMSSSELHRLYSAFTEAGGHWSTFIIWGKNAFTLGRSNYQRQYEPILYGWREGHKHYWCGKRDQGDLWMVDKPFRNDVHPTMKPVELVERAIRNSSRAGEIVLDAYAGSGSTLIACQRTGRAARLVEIDPRYVDVIVRRWQEYTGQATRLEGDGRTFAELSQARLSAREQKEAA